MRALLTSSGVRNDSVRAALVDLLGKPIAECHALFVVSGIYPFPGGAGAAWRAVHGDGMHSLGWKSVGLLELTALPHIDEEAWLPAVREADALLVWGGDPLFLARFLRQSAVTEHLRPEAVYVGVSAGAIAATSTFVETYVEPPPASDGALKSEPAVFATPDGDVDRLLVTGRGAGLVDFAIIPHFENPRHPDASAVNAEKWAAHIPAPTYALDDESAVVVRDGDVRVVSEGQWRLYDVTAAD
ncbi:Type 1 glutamine amidotransferase-like domain-containing protein [Paractinoplanes lichenicola]|uniref:Type 1 glutamine amidotransferase-like domain-containing protein n=1 Tax=Paractinoplanes lichenicola TaxID=2802976 RepID=A0ABS1VT25_9ACTN|nr:Type 1 glutamine amidotransferase-like domain-containing protein [Actinoplanes lichenicola]MBL7257614.1 Type 1 glutamine amidotransferase-like domain-containing protein [Actinoplanes lichenicola]